MRLCAVAAYETDNGAISAADRSSDFTCDLGIASQYRIVGGSNHWSATANTALRLKSPVSTTLCIRSPSAPVLFLRRPQKVSCRDNLT